MKFTFVPAKIKSVCRLRLTVLTIRTVSTAKRLIRFEERLSKGFAVRISLSQKKIASISDHSDRRANVTVIRLYRAPLLYRYSIVFLSPVFNKRTPITKLSVIRNFYFYIRQNKRCRKIFLLLIFQHVQYFDLRSLEGLREDAENFRIVLCKNTVHFSHHIGIISFNPDFVIIKLKCMAISTTAISLL